MEVQDIISKTIRYMEIIDRAIGNNADEREKLGTRLVNLPSMILSDGLVPTLLFYYSKSGTKALVSAYKLLSGESGESLKEGGNADYALSLAFTIRILNDMGENIGEPHDKDSRTILEIFLKMREKEAEYEAILIPVLVEARKIAEAIFKKQ